MPAEPCTNDEKVLDITISEPPPTWHVHRTLPSKSRTLTPFRLLVGFLLILFLFSSQLLSPLPKVIERILERIGASCRHRTLPDLYEASFSELEAGLDRQAFTSVHLVQVCVALPSNHISILIPIDLLCSNR